MNNKNKSVVSGIADKAHLSQNKKKENRAGKTFQETTEYLENLLNYANAPIIVWDTNYEITRFNKAFESLTGRIEKDVIGKSLEILFPPASREDSMELIRKSFESERWEVVEIAIVHIDGSVQIVLWNSATIMSADGKTPLATIAQGQNITKRKLAEEEIKKLNEKLEKNFTDQLIANKELAFQNEEKEKRAAELIIANKELVFQNEEKEKRAAELIIANKELAFQNKELEQFAYVVSHDLQEPLRTIMSFAGLINEEFKGKLDENGDKYLGFLLQSSLRMQILVKGLLDYSRIGKEKGLARVDCNLIVNEVLADLDVFIKESGARITILKLPELNGYGTELRQLFQNLISNALKFRKKNVAPEIKVSAHKQAGGWLFSIQDNGIGIDEKDKDKIFIIFKRLHNRNEYEGTGIGLSLCKKIAELHGGTIWVDSKPGEGSIFKLTIPKL